MEETEMEKAEKSSSTRPVSEALRDIEKARHYVAQWRKRFRVKSPPSEKTIKQYAGKLRRLLYTEVYMTEMRSKSTFHVYRAALNYSGPALLEQVLEKAECEKQESRNWWGLVNGMKYCLALLDAYPADPDRRHVTLEAGERTTLSWSDHSKNRKRPKKKSKRNVLKYLPDDWMNRVWDQLPKEINHPRARGTAADLQAAVAVLSACGCRPAEIEKGVTVYVNAEGLVVIEVEGVKVSDTAGQESRQLFAKRNTSWTRHLAALAGSGQAVITADANWLYDWVSRIGDRCEFPELKRRNERLSPYVYRHALSAQLKSQGWPEESIAALGHRVTRTQQHYATRRQAKKGSVTLVGCKCTSDIKPNRRKPPQGRINRKAKKKGPSRS